MGWLGRPSATDEARAERFRDWLCRQNPLAVSSFVLGIVSIIEFGLLLVFGVAGIVLGCVALVQLRNPEPDAPQNGHWLAWTGISLSAVSLALAAVIYLVL